MAICKRGHASSALPGGRNTQRRCKECYREKAHDDPVYMLWNGAKQRAKALGIEFTLTQADIVIPERCPWLDIPLVGARNQGRGPRDNSPTLDRIIPEVGYVRGNIIVISSLANRIKNNATPEQLARVLKGLRSAYPQWLLID